MQNFTVTDRERDTVLAALRYYHFYGCRGILSIPARTT